MMTAALTTSAFWDDAWSHKLADYLSARPRTGQYMAARLPRRTDGILEVGAGSARDSIYLSRVGYRGVVASDFSPKCIEELGRRFPDRARMFRVADAFALPFPDKSFDVVFHNGLFVNFRDDDDIVRMLKEQVRVARKWIVALVHNGENERLVAEFKRQAKTDPIFDLRFFTRGDVRGIASPFGAVHVEKFGGKWDALANSSVKGIPNPLAPFAKSLPAHLYQLQPWRWAERLACWIRVQ
jgi:ubiquinone/menaquinone biosynthesis C-methylase UbiE